MLIAIRIHLTGRRSDAPELAPTMPGAHVFEADGIVRGTIPIGAVGVAAVQIESAPGERLAAATKYAVRIGDDGRNMRVATD